MLAQGSRDGRGTIRFTAPYDQQNHDKPFWTSPGQMQQGQGSQMQGMQGQQQQQQQQQGQQQGMQGQAQQQGQGGSVDGQSNAASGPSVASEMSLAGVLHYLQSEWRRWERDRNEWEIERAEMRARIALLEGQRRSAENLKVDLLRRVKMLEFALRQERTKSMSTAGRASSLAPSRISAIQDEDKSSNRDEKEASPSSEGSDEGDRPKVNGTKSVMATSKVSSISKGASENPWKSLGSSQKDPKARARSREYLKQCLQEITYLTSPGALNPLPPRVPITIESEPAEHTDPEHAESSSQSHSEYQADRLRPPRKTLPDQPLTYKFAHPDAPAPSEETPESSAAPKWRSQPNGSSSSPERPASTDTHSTPPTVNLQPESESAPNKTVVSRAMATENTARLPHSPMRHTMELPDADSADSGGSGVNGEVPDREVDGHQMLTAIYRPDSKNAWREELQAANEEAEKVQSERTPSEQSDEEQLANLSMNIDDDDTKSEIVDVPDRLWTSKQSLRSHLEIVRTVALHRTAALGRTVQLVSAGDDNVVKVWTLDPEAIMAPKSSTAELEPNMTFRGHTAPITSLAISSSHEPLIFSASLDSTIRVWRIPPTSHSPYASYDSSFTVQTLEAHTDAIWDLLLIPSPFRSASPKKDGSANSNAQSLVSISADSSLRIWNEAEDGKWFADRVYSVDVTPTCLSVYHPDPTKVLVGLSDGRMRLWDAQDGLTQTWQGGDEAQSPINATLSHPTLPILINGDEDGMLRVYDAKHPSSVPQFTTLAHTSPITALALSPVNPMHIFTASADCRIRIWDMDKNIFLQDLQGHRPRSDEGVCALACEADIPLLASAGADGVVKIWAWA